MFINWSTNICANQYILNWYYKKSCLVLKHNMPVTVKVVSQQWTHTLRRCFRWQSSQEWPLLPLGPLWIGLQRRLLCLEQAYSDLLSVRPTALLHQQGSTISSGLQSIHCGLAHKWLAERVGSVVKELPLGSTWFAPSVDQNDIWW